MNHLDEVGCPPIERDGRGNEDFCVHFIVVGTDGESEEVLVGGLYCLSRLQRRSPHLICCALLYLL